MSETNENAIDIGRRQVAGVYANALFGAAQAARSTDVVLQEFGGFVTQVVSANPKVRDFLESPRIKAEEKKAMLEKTLTKRVTPITLRFLKVVADHDRLDCLVDTHTELRRLYNESKGIVQVQITTAEPIDRKEEKIVRDALKAKFNAPLDLDMKVDPNMIGGVVVRVGDKVYDGSVAQKLRSLREDAVRNTVKKMRDATDTFAAS